LPEERRFLPARLAARESAGGGLVRIVLEPAPELLPTYVAPGQYVEMRTAGETGFFVLASDPGSDPWQLVMRSGGGASDVVLVAPVGSMVELTGALGDGFPMTEARGQALVVVLHGTGVAAGPPLVGARIRDGEVATTTVLVGVRVEGELPMADELLSWAAAGVDVTVCLSQGDPAAIDARLGTVRGYVQDVLREKVASRELRLEPDRTLVFAVGGASVIDALRRVARALGLPPERVRSNY